MSYARVNAEDGLKNKDFYRLQTNCTFPPSFGHYSRHLINIKGARMGQFIASISMAYIDITSVR